MADTDKRFYRPGETVALAARTYDESATRTGRYRVVYFTELQDHNKETEINHALAGEHYFDGFIKNFRKDEAKEIIDGLLARLNNGERIDPQEVERALGDHMA